MSSQLLNKAAGKRGELRLAYITDVFPAVSLTFVYLEIEKLRQLEMAIDFYAIWKWHEKTRSHDAEFLTNDTTYLSPPSIAALVRDHCYYICHAPVQYLRNFSLCWFRHPTLHLYRRTFYNFLLAPSFARILKKRKTGHVHAHFAFGAATTAMMASNLVDIGFSFTAHRGDILIDIDKSLVSEKLRKAKFAIAISEYNKRFLMQEAPEIDENKVKVIHCGVDPDIFYPLNGREGETPVFLAVGRLVEDKGHADLIEACALLANSNVEFRCIILGEGPERQRLEQLLSRHGLGEKVELAGAIPHEKIQAYLDRAQVIVHPSISEGIPVAVMEAMSKGLPVIATRITGVPELICHEKDGLLVSPGDVTGLAEAMKRLLNNKEMRRDLGRNARQKVVQNFNLNSNSKRLKKLFEEELAREQL